MASVYYEKSSITIDIRWVSQNTTKYY